MKTTAAAIHSAAIKGRPSHAEGGGEPDRGCQEGQAWPSGRDRHPRGIPTWTWSAELCDLRWDLVDLDGANLHVRRVKSGTPSTHPLQGDEMRLCGASNARAIGRHPSCSSASGVPRSLRPGPACSDGRPAAAKAGRTHADSLSCPVPQART
jgi:hypothetical protein